MKRQGKQLSLTVSTLFSSEGAILKIINQAFQADLQNWGGGQNLYNPIVLRALRIVSAKFMLAATISLGDCPNTHLRYVLKQRESGNGEEERREEICFLHFFLESWHPLH